MVSVDGWQLFAHPLLLEQLERLMKAVERLQKKAPEKFRQSANAKLLASLNKLMFETIPADPSRPEYRQGSTLGPAHKHWFHAKLGGQRFRLFFRYDSKAKVIIYAWVSDQDTLRTYGSRTDAYAVFRSMLEKGTPPDDWSSLFAASVSL